MKIGFIGLGNMAQAMIGGILTKGLYQKQDIIGSCKTEETAERIREQFGIAAGTDNRRTADEAEVIVLAVKPIFLQEVITEIRDLITEKRKEKLVISIAAGRSTAWIEEMFAVPLRLARCMPNTPALVGEGCTCVCLKEDVTPQDKALVLSIMESFGKASILPERLMDAFIGVAGSSPAYVFLFIEAMADAAVAAGMPRKQAYEFAASAVAGSARMVLETGIHPGELKDMVCSPGGTTIEGIAVLEEKGMRAAVIEAVGACVEKSKKL